MTEFSPTGTLSIYIFILTGKVATKHMLLSLPHTHKHLWQNAPLSLCVSQMSFSWMPALNPVGSVCAHMCKSVLQQVCCVSRPTLKCLISPPETRENTSSLPDYITNTHTHTHTHFLHQQSLFLSEWSLKSHFISVCFTKCFIYPANICI